MTELFPPIDKSGLGDQVYLAISKSLASGALKPGTRLTIRSLAEKMGVSVTPVRDAVLRLVQDGGLVFRGPRDIRVPVIDHDRYMEIRRIRMELEGLGAQTAAERRTPADIAMLEELVAANEKALLDGDTATAISLNQQFHFSLLQIADMPLLQEIVRRLWLQMGPVISAAYQQGGRVMISYHYDVLNAIRDGNGPMARAAIQRDLAEGGDIILSANVLGPEAAP